LLKDFNEFHQKSLFCLKILMISSKSSCFAAGFQCFPAEIAVLLKDFNEFQQK